MRRLPLGLWPASQKVCVGLDTHTFSSECVRILCNTVRQLSRIEQYDSRREGISREMLTDDSQLLQRRTELIESSARILANLSMIDSDLDAKTFIIKDIGRIAAKYYIRHQSIEVFQTLFRPQMTEADVLYMLSKSTEVCHFFRDIQIVIQRRWLCSSLIKSKSENQRLRSWNS